MGAPFARAASEIAVPAVPPRAIVDPTGVGDAFRGGLLKGLATGCGLEVACRLGSVAATYALEHLGGQSHAYTWEEFRDALRAPTSDQLVAPNSHSALPFLYMR